MDFRFYLFFFCSTPKTSQCLRDTLDLEISLISTTIQTRGILTTPGTKDTPAPMVAPGIVAMWTTMLINRILTTQPIIQVVGELAVEILLLPRRIEPEKRQLLKGNWLKLLHSVIACTSKKSNHFWNTYQSERRTSKFGWIFPTDTYLYRKWRLKSKSL